MANILIDTVCPKRLAESLRRGLPVTEVKPCQYQVKALELAPFRHCESYEVNTGRVGFNGDLKCTTIPHNVNNQLEQPVQTHACRRRLCRTGSLRYTNAPPKPDIIGPPTMQLPCRKPRFRYDAGRYSTRRFQSNNRNGFRNVAG